MPLTRRASHHHTLHLRVIRDLPPVALVGVPIDITIVMLAQQPHPIFPRLLMSAGLLRAAIDYVRASHGPSEGIRAGINRIAKHCVDGVIHRRPPLHYAAHSALLSQRGQRERLLPEPKQHLARAAELGEFAKDQFDRLSYA